MKPGASSRIYSQLVRLYPKRFREEYATEMARLFGEQCRDARERGFAGIAALWLRTIHDLAFSLIREHIESKGHMSARSILDFCGRKLTFGRLFAAMTVCLIAACLLATLLLPKVYSSLARIEFAGPAGGAGTYDPYMVQTAFERVRSGQVLNPVIDKLNLSSVLAKEMGVPGTLSREEAREALLSRLELRQSRNTSLVEIRVYSTSPELSANIANAIAEGSKRAMGSRLVDQASPGTPVRPNVPLNMVVGTIASVAIAVVLAGLARLLLRRIAPAECR